MAAENVLVAEKLLLAFCTASVPVVGSVTLVVPVLVSVIGLAPEIVNAAAVVMSPDRFRFRLL